MRYFVAGIDTNCGKTLVSAILTHALQADYWKPVQTGFPDSDRETVESLVNNGHSLFFREIYNLKEPVSPHEAADRAGIKIDLEKIEVPATDNHLVVEGAGGILTPLNEQHTIIDIAVKLKAEVVLVSRHYLGSINHTLLTYNELVRRGLKIKGIVFNGNENSYTEDIILKFTGLKVLLRIKEENAVDQAMITRYAIDLFKSWDNE